MKTFSLRLPLLLLLLGPPALSQPAGIEITLTGFLESRIAIGGETTGWILRHDGDQTIEVTFEGDLLSRAREHLQIAVTGIIELRRYPERGAVRVLVVSLLKEVVGSTAELGQQRQRTKALESERAAMAREIQRLREENAHSWENH